MLKLTHNGLALGEEADFEAHNFLPPMNRQFIVGAVRGSLFFLPCHNCYNVCENVHLCLCVSKIKKSGYTCRMSNIFPSHFLNSQRYL
jgi:hypothetical protein